MLEITDIIAQTQTLQFHFLFQIAAHLVIVSVLALAMQLSFDLFQKSTNINFEACYHKQEYTVEFNSNACLA